jgi:hypothetical protein
VNDLKTTRIRNKVKAYLEGRPRSTSEIRDYINTNTRYGTSNHQLINVLAKNKDFVKVGRTELRGLNGDKQRNDVWSLKE